MPVKKTAEDLKPHPSTAAINRELAQVRLDIEKAKLAKLRREIADFEQEGDGYNAMTSPTAEQRVELLSRINLIYQSLRVSADKQRAQSKAVARENIWARDREKAP